MTRWILALCLAAIPAVVVATEPVSVHLKNDLDAERKEIPVFLRIAQVLGPDYGFDGILLDGFDIRDEKRKPVTYSVIVQKPLQKKGKDLVVFVVPAMAAQEEKVYTIAYKGKKNPAFGSVDYASTAANLFTNAGFEKGEGEQAEGYTYKGSCLRDTKVFRNGKASLCLAAEHNKKTTAHHATKISLTSGRNYELRFWGRCENLPVADSSSHDATKLGGGATDCRVTWAGTAIKKLGFWHSWIKPLTGTRDWRMYSRRLTAKATKEIDFRWRLFHYKMAWLKDGPGHMWVDDAILYEPLQVRIDHIRLTANLQQNGVLLFHAPIELPIMPTSKPWPQQVIQPGKGLKVVMAKNDHETVQFGVNAAKDMKGVTYALGALRGPSGAAFPAGKVELFRIDADQFMRPTQPTEMAAGASQGFAIRLCPDGKAAPGVYRGTIAVKAEGGALGSIPLEVSVLPWDLPKVPDRYLGTCIPHADWVRKNFDLVFKNNGEHSYNFNMYMTWTGAGKSMDDFDAFIKRHEKAGMPLSAIGLFSDVCRHRKGPAASAAKYAALEAEAKKRGWPRIVFMMDDEIFTIFQKSLRDAPLDRLVQAIKGRSHSYADWARANPKAIITADMNFTYSSYFHEPYTYLNFDNPYGGLNAQVLDWARNVLKKDIGLCGAGGRNADLQRYHNGFFMLLVDAHTMWRWVYTHHVKFEDGVIRDAVAHEALREGFEDIRWYYLLDAAIKKAKTEGNAVQKAKAGEAEKYLASVFSIFSKDTIVGSYTPIEGMPGGTWGEYRFCDRWREKMIEFIKAIKDSKKVEFQAPEIVKAGETYPLTDIRFFQTGTGGLEWRKLFYRTKGEKAYKETPVEDAGEGRFKANIPAAATSGAFQFYFQYKEKGKAPAIEPPDGTQKPETVIPDITAPTKAGNLRALSAKDHGVQLAWESAKDDKGVAAYHMHRGEKEGFALTDANRMKELVAGATQFGDAKPPAGKTVWYALRAVDVVGRPGALAYLKVDVPADRKPDNTLKVAAAPASCAVVLSWEGKLEPDVTEVRIFRADGPGKEMKIVQTVKDLKQKLHKDGGLKKDVVYRYSLKLVDAAGHISDPSAEIEAKPLGFVRRINCGGDQVDAEDGIAWKADSGRSSSSSRFKTQTSIKKAGKLQAVYQSERWSYSGISYRFEVTPGKYKVVLHFAETNKSFHAAGKRRFDVLINGEVVAKQVDIFKEAGANTAWRFEKTVAVKDEILRVSLRKNPTGPSIRGVEVMEVGD